jgi:hypothetical protein
MSAVATRKPTRRRTTTAARRTTIFVAPRHRRLAEIISIESPAAFRGSIRTLKKMGIGAREKRALVLAQNRAKAMLKKKTLSPKERRELQQIANTPLPPVTRR